MLYELGARLQRIILDEIQICFSEEFRSIVGQYKRWRSWLSFNAPIVYLSGSFPPAWEEHFQAAFGAPSAHVPIVRESDAEITEVAAAAAEIVNDPVVEISPESRALFALASTQ